MARNVSFFDSLGRILALEREAERARMEALAEGLSLQQREEAGLSGRILVTRAPCGAVPGQ